MLHSELSVGRFARLDALHGGFVAAYPQWEERVEIAYLTQAALKTFRTQSSPIAIISPGEPFHFKEAGHDWLINWWIVRRQGVALYGPPAQDVIDPIGDDEFQPPCVGRCTSGAPISTRRSGASHRHMPFSRSAACFMPGTTGSRFPSAAPNGRQTRSPAAVGANPRCLAVAQRPRR